MAPIGAEKLPDAELPHHAVVGPRQIGDSPLIAAIDAPCGKPAHGTVHQRLRRLHSQGHLPSGGVNLPCLRVEQAGLREQARQKFYTPLKGR